MVKFVKDQFEKKPIPNPHPHTIIRYIITEIDEWGGAGRSKVLFNF